MKDFIRKENAKMRNDFLKTGERIRYLMNKKGIKNAPALAEAMYTAGIISYPEDMEEKNMTKKECHLSAGRTINNHLKYLNSPEQLSGLWVKRYCDFFHCSADYLMGYISQPTHETASVHDQTGLSEKAIRILQKFYERDRATGYSETVSHLIEDKDFELLLHYIKMKESGFLETTSYNLAYSSLKAQDVIDFKTSTVFNDISKRVRKRRLTSLPEIRQLYAFAYSCYDDGRLTEDQLNDVISHYDEGDFNYVPESIKSDVSKKV